MTHEVLRNTEDKRIITSTPIELESLLGRSVSGEEIRNPVGRLSRSMIRIYSADNHNFGTREYLATIDRRFGAGDLHRLLTAIAPSPFDITSGTYPIISDWEMPNEAKKGDLNYFTDLYQKHSSYLGNEWQEFMEHLPKFLSTIKGHRLFTPAISWFLLDDKRVWNFDLLSNNNSAILGSRVDNYDTILGMLVVLYTQSEEIDAWSREQDLGGKYKNPMAQAQVPVLALQKHGEIIKSDFFEKAEEYLRATT